MNAAIDVRSVLPSIRVPTLVLHRRDDARIKFGGGQYLADKTAGARFGEFPGRDHPIWTGDIDPIIDEIEEFLTGTRPSPTGDRVLATVLATIFLRYNGHLGSVGPEEIVGHFDGPARAVRCGITLQDHAKTLGGELAIGNSHRRNRNPRQRLCRTDRARGRKYFRQGTCR
jgi:hypothetical protein